MGVQGRAGTLEDKRDAISRDDTVGTLVLAVQIPAARPKIGPVSSVDVLQQPVEVECAIRHPTSARSAIRAPHDGVAAAPTSSLRPVGLPPRSQARSCRATAD